LGVSPVGLAVLATPPSRPTPLPQEGGS
jgi:hypothetical protein